MIEDKSLHDFLCNAARLSGVRRYLEVGCREGDSLRQIVANSPTLERVVVCDMWGPMYGGTGRGNHDHIDAMLNGFSYTGSRLFLDGDSKETVPALREEFDLVLVDGDHSPAGALADLTNCWPLVESKGQLVFHDICHPAHRELMVVFMEFMSQQTDCAGIKTILEGHGVAIAWKK
jgi:predicted O-methyltransferase YrrM